MIELVFISQEVIQVMDNNKILNKPKIFDIIIGFTWQETVNDLIHYLMVSENTPINLISKPVGFCLCINCIIWRITNLIGGIRSGCREGKLTLNVISCVTYLMSVFAWIRFDASPTPLACLHIFSHLWKNLSRHIKCSSNVKKPF